MKPIFFSLLCTIRFFGFAQTDSSAKLLPVTLDTAAISSRAYKVARIHRSGFPSYNGLSQTGAVVSYTGILPGGMLKSVSFYFNCGIVNRIKKRLQIEYKDVELSLLIYKANGDSTMGEALSQDQIRFTVPAHHRGVFTINVLSLNITEPELFIGFAVLSKLPTEENNIYVRYNESNTAKSYVKINLSNMSGNWQRPFEATPSELRMRLDIMH